MTSQLVHIDIDVRIDGDQIAGHAGDGVSQPRPFLGWLGLISTLDRLMADPVSARETTSERESRSDTTAARSRRRYRQRVPGLAVGGKEPQAGVFDENEVRAAAGLTMVIGALAFCYAYFRHLYLPMQVGAAPDLGFEVCANGACDVPRRCRMLTRRLQTAPSAC